jgi:hypothetical protein
MQRHVGGVGAASARQSSSACRLATVCLRASASVQLRPAHLQRQAQPTPQLKGVGVKNVLIDGTGALRVQVYNDVTALMDGMFLTKDGAMGQLEAGEEMPDGAKVGAYAVGVHPHDTSLISPPRIRLEGVRPPGSQWRSRARGVALPSGTTAVTTVVEDQGAEEALWGCTPREAYHYVGLASGLRRARASLTALVAAPVREEV